MNKELQIGQIGVIDGVRVQKVRYDRFNPYDGLSCKSYGCAFFNECWEYDGDGYYSHTEQFGKPCDVGHEKKLKRVYFKRVEE